MKVTDYYGISPPVPFVDVHVDVDNRLFLDPSAIRNHATGGLAMRAHTCLVSFFTEVLRCRRSGNTADLSKGEAMLWDLHEPNETRLGMSRAGVAGHAFGEDLGSRLWQELDVNSACRTAAVSRLEDVALFIKGVGPDLISDLATRIIYDVLVDFTHQMIAAFPALGASTDTVQVRRYDASPGSMNWVPATFTLPACTPHPLLLVPKEWVYWRLIMNPPAFYNRHSTRVVQEERTSFDLDGKPMKPSKEVIKEEFPDIKELNSDETARQLDGGTNLVSTYRLEVDGEYQPLADGEIATRMEP